MSPQLEPHNCETVTLSIVIPVYNEERTIAIIVNRLLTIKEICEIVIVDDCSTDGTPNIIQELEANNHLIRSIRLSRNQGKTAALKAGFAHTTGSIVMIQDADLEYDPAEIPEVIYPIVYGHADVVYGSRFMIKRAARVLYFYHYLANKGLTFISNLLTNLNITDIETCYKAFRGDIIRSMIITSSGFGFEIEVTAKIAKLKCVLYEVPISYYGRTYEEGKKIKYHDGLAAFFYIIRFNLFCSLKKSFVPVPGINAPTTPLLDSQ